MEPPFLVVSLPDPGTEEEWLIGSFHSLSLSTLQTFAPGSFISHDLPSTHIPGTPRFHPK